MQAFNVDKEKTLNAALLILNKLGEADYHKIFKILYFAEQQHLKNYGQPLTGDTYQAMPYGPVPSFLYDIFKASENQSSPFGEALELAKAFSVKRKDKIPFVTANNNADTDELSETNIDAILASIEENHQLSFKEITDKSHDTAWAKAEQAVETEMSYLDIAESAQATPEMLKYISLHAENNHI
ncbi:Panacea domain-containing protein [Pedobacter sp. AW31-3R]|uniref:Panacea domain-containing protein n=1 Tax=Pedobacter sp. AW31-3R TaxID=3445781 RepID=UPI003FA14EEE